MHHPNQIADGSALVENPIGGTRLDCDGVSHRLLVDRQQGLR